MGRDSRRAKNKLDCIIAFSPTRASTESRPTEPPRLRQIAFAAAENRAAALIRILRRSFFPLRAASGIFPRCQVANFVGGLPAGRYFGFDRHIQFLSLLLESQSGNPVCLD